MDGKHTLHGHLFYSHIFLAGKNNQTEKQKNNPKHIRLSQNGFTELPTMQFYVCCVQSKQNDKTVPNRVVCSQDGWYG